MAKTKLMGILNVTPDSFYDQGASFNQHAAIERGIQLFKDGADLLDIGGESTRPGASPVGTEEELARVIPVIRALKKEIPVPLSIDTMKPAVATRALEAGASLINDVSGFRNPEMIALAASHHCKICVMHMLSEPKTMQNNPHYELGIIPTLLNWFEERINTLTRSGVRTENIILDPGIGFGKTVADNLKIIDNLPKLKRVGFPLLLGVSRKSFMGKIVNRKPAELLHTTIAINTCAILAKVDMIRVHDVKEHREVIDVLEYVSAPCSST